MNRPCTHDGCSGWEIDPGVCAVYYMPRDHFEVTHHETAVTVEIPRARCAMGFVRLRDVRDPAVQYVLRSETMSALRAVRNGAWPQIQL